MIVTMLKNQSHRTAHRIFNNLEVSAPDASNDDSEETIATSISPFEFSGDCNDDEESSRSVRHSLIEALDLCSASNFKRRPGNIGLGIFNVPKPNYGVISNKQCRSISLGSSFQRTQEDTNEVPNAASFNETIHRYRNRIGEIASRDDESTVAASDLIRGTASRIFEGASQLCNSGLDMENASSVTEDCTEAFSQLFARSSLSNGRDPVKIAFEHLPAPDLDNRSASHLQNRPVSTRVKPQQPAVVCGHCAEALRPALAYGRYADASVDSSFAVPLPPTSTRSHRAKAQRPSRRSPFKYLQNLSRMDASPDPSEAPPTIAEDGRGNDDKAKSPKSAKKMSRLKPENWKLFRADPREDDPIYYKGGKFQPTFNGTLWDAIESEAHRVKERWGRRHGVSLNSVSRNF
jgi:hypothetical protein